MFRIPRTCEVATFGIDHYTYYNINTKHPLLSLDEETLQTVTERGFKDMFYKYVQEFKKINSQISMPNSI